MNEEQKNSLKGILTALILTVLIRISQALIPYNTITVGSFPAGRVLLFALYMVPYLIVGHEPLGEAVEGIRNGEVFDENFLMTVATVGAIVLAAAKTGDYVEAVAVMLFYQVGELFEDIAVGKSRKNIAELMDIRPDYASLEKDGKLLRVSPEEVPAGSVILVQPGEKIPIDGVILEGNTTLNTAALTGESLPREAAPGDEVISGCVSMTGLIRVRTTKAFGESTVSRILDLVENAASRKSRSEDFISRFARIYTPVVCFSALALAVLPPLFRLLTGSSPAFGTWVYRALTFLVISCPCALVVSIPLSFFAGIGGASHEGILIKGSNYLEALASMGTAAFDKTGSLTEGIFTVTEILPAAGGPEKKEVLRLAAAAESCSSHPISRSLREACGAEMIDPALITEVTESGGFGVEATVSGKRIAAGNARLMEKLGIVFEPCARPGTIVYAAVDGIYAGCIVISDRLKPTAKAAVAALREAGVRRTVMLTGDSRAAAEAVAAELGITEVYSGLLPEDKVAKVEELLSEVSGKENGKENGSENEKENGSEKENENGNDRRKEKLAFVGDGINDAPVLSRADIGIAMGALGSDAAIEAADVVLMDDDPLKVAKAVRISKKCMRIVRENIWGAIGIKLLCLLLGALGITGMGAAIFADTGVLVLAVLNAMRALRVKNV